MGAPAHHEFIVAGLGTFGGAVARHLARRGRRVLGLDRFRPPHASGSHHGRTRIIRQAYFEHPAYVPLVRRAFEGWRELEGESGRTLLRTTGALLLGVPEGEVVPGARASARLHGLAHEDVPLDRVRRRHPELRVPDGLEAIFEPDAGVLSAESCIEAHLEAAARDGAELRFDEPVTGWSADGDGVRVETTAGRYTADALVVAAGAWMAGLVEALAGRLVVERQTVFWFDPATPGTFAPGSFPVFLVEPERGRLFYGFPDLGDGVKLAVHHGGETAAAPSDIRREVGAADVRTIRDLCARFLSGLRPEPRECAVCLYTNTPDSHFVLDFLPGGPRVLVGSPCSGHGFKFAPVLGEAAADLLTEGHTPHDLTLFRL